MDVVRYIIEFLLYGNTEAAKKVAYAPMFDDTGNAIVTILGDGLTGELHYPNLTHPEVETLPSGRYIIHTDIVYNAFFFISRAEEVLNPRRDQYGRFLAVYSMLQPNDLQIPLVDEYSRILMKLMDLPLPEPGFDAVHLTHDIDTLTSYRHLRGAIGGICRGQWQQVKASLRDLRNDPAYTFPWMMEQDAECIKSAQCTMHNAQCIYFVKDTPGRGIDYPQYNLHGRDWCKTKDMLLHRGAQLGLHSSAYDRTSLPKAQLHRSHYLACSIDRMQQLADAGVTDDYTMGFADMAGFRLQTTRAVRWINPLSRQLTSLTLHPLTMMDCTLSNANYMHLTEDEAYFMAQELIEKVRQHHGEVNLLWHNTSFGEDSYHRSLYPKILQLI